MQLIFFVEKYYKHTSFDLFIKQINKYIKNKKYIVVKKRNKLSKLKIVMKIVLNCDRDNK